MAEWSCAQEDGANQGGCGAEAGSRRATRAVVKRRSLAARTARP